MTERGKPETYGFSGKIVKITTPNTAVTTPKTGDGQKGYQGRPTTTPPKTGKSR